MPHLIFEVTDNIEQTGDIPGLLRKANQALIHQGDVFPIGGIRSRAIILKTYCVADGTCDDAFVHATLKIGSGRSPEVKQQLGEELFRLMCEHFAVLYESRHLALSLEITEFSEAGTWKKNNIHARYKKRIPLDA